MTQLVVYDLTLDRPACVLVAAALGGSTAVAKLFPSELWLLAPTPQMKVYEISDAGLALLVKRLEWRARDLGAARSSPTPG